MAVRSWKYNGQLILGIALLGVSAYCTRESLSFLHASEIVQGTVVTLAEEYSSESGKGYRPVYRYTTHAGGTFSYSPAYTTNPPAWRVGDTEMIAYDPESPQNARLLTYFGVFAWSIVFGACAMPLIVIGVGYHLFRWYVR